MNTTTIFTAEQLSAMGKNELRLTCKSVGVKGYGNMNNDGMRAAVLAAQTEFEEVEATIPPLPVAEDIVDDDTAAFPPPAPAGSLAAMFGLTVKPVENTCKNVTTVIDGKRVDPHAAPPVTPRDSALPRSTSKDLKLQKERETRNGVTRHSDGTIGAEIWAYYDAHPKTVSADIPAIAEEHGWKELSCRASLYHWRKFMGLTGK